MRNKILKWVAKRIRSEDLVFLICKWMLVNDCPKLEFNYGGKYEIFGLVTKSSYAGDDKA